MKCPKVPIADNIFLIQAKRNGRFPYSHSILFLDTETVLIDTGCGIRTLKQLRKEYNIDYVINSHAHPDHSAGNWVFKDTPIYVPEEEFQTSGNILALSIRFAGEQLAPVWRKFVQTQLEFKECKPTNSYNKHTIFDFGRIILRPVFTPGHTKGHYCFLERRKNILFSFDYDLTSFPWYGHVESNLLEFRKSIQKLESLSPRIVVSSHRGVITQNIRHEFARFRRKIDERDERILALLESAKSLDELVDAAPIYGRFPYAESLLQYWEKQMIRKHLELLEKDSKVVRASQYKWKCLS